MALVAEYNLLVDENQLEAVEMRPDVALNPPGQLRQTLGASIDRNDD